MCGATRTPTSASALPDVVSVVTAKPPDAATYPRSVCARSGVAAAPTNAANRKIIFISPPPHPCATQVCHATREVRRTSAKRFVRVRFATRWLLPKTDDPLARLSSNEAATSTFENAAAALKFFTRARRIHRHGPRYEN